MDIEPRQPAGDKPKSEPEIIPPGASDPWQSGGGWSQQEWRGGAFRVYSGRIGPLGVFLIVLSILLILALLLLLFLGAIFIWLPAAAMIAIGSVIIAWLRGAFRR